MLDAVSIDNCRFLTQTLGHSLWQASVAATVCWLALRSLPAKQATKRYAVTCGGLLAVVLATLITAAAVTTSSTIPMDAEVATARNSAAPSGNSHPTEVPQHSVAAASSGDNHDRTAATHADHASAIGGHEMEVAGSDSKVADRSPAIDSADRGQQSQLMWPVIVAGVWSFGVLAMMFRLARTIVALRRLQPSETPVDETMLSQLGEVIAELSRRMNLRWPVALVVSDKVLVPGIVGTFWPTLLIPPAMLTGVPVEQLRIVIAHELAHARRFDFLVNRGQLLVESFLFFNPAVWWLSRQIRIEREACCDASAVAATGSAVPVARTLLDIVDRLTESLGAGASGDFAIAVGVQSFGGDESPKSTTPLFDRVRRIVTPDQRPHIRVPWYTLIGVVAAYVVVSFGLYEGADATVQIVQQALSPKERVEKIEELIASQGDLARRESVPVYRSDEPKPGSLFPEPVTVSGIVRTSDGSFLPTPLTIFGTFSGRGIGGNEMFLNLHELKSEARFSGNTTNQKRVKGDTATLSLYVGFRRDSEATKRFAPSAVGPFTIRSGQVIDNLELVLQPGFDGRLRVVDPSNNPISKAFVSGMFHVDDASSYARRVSIGNGSGWHDNDSDKHFEADMDGRNSSGRFSDRDFRSETSARRDPLGRIETVSPDDSQNHVWC
jgi:beta-lactamase regulating signal transducer with metallopeptidase domain